MKYLLCACILAASVAVAGCKGVPVPLARNFYGLVVPRYTKSVNEDGRLSEDQKKALLQGVASFDKLLRKMEE